MIGLWMVSPVAWLLFAVREIAARCRERKTHIRVPAAAHEWRWPEGTH